jgi:hypothetical protein
MEGRTISEHEEQCSIMQWAKLLEGRYPELALLAAIPNGAKLPYIQKNGRRFSPEAIRLKDEGLKPGFPDMILPCPRGHYHGLFIELKYGRNKPTPEQAAWLDALNEQGYLAVACWGAEDAIEVINEYLETKTS